MFKKTTELAHLSFILVIFGLIMQTISIYFQKDSGFLLGLSMTLYFSAFPFAVASLIANFRYSDQKKLGLIGFIEVGIGILPFLLAILLIIYAYSISPS